MIRLIILPDIDFLKCKFKKKIQVGILGNLLVLVVIVTEAHMQTTTNMYILNMAIADILMCLGKKCFIWKFCTTDKQTQTQK